MKSKIVHPSLAVRLCALICAAFLYFPVPVAGQKMPPSASLRVSGGLQTITFEMAIGRVIVHLPDDMAAGDTISGTVMTEPKGNTAEERATAQASLNNHILRIGDQNVPVTKPVFTWNVPFAPQRADAGYKIVIVEIPPRTVPPNPTPPPPTTDPEMVTITISPFERPDFFWLYQTAKTPQSTPPTLPPPNFHVPSMGQQARPIQIFGPFDGDSLNTTLMFGPSRSTLQDFEKNTENVSGGYGLIRPLAESPRKVIFESPRDVTGPVAIMLKEGSVSTIGNYRNVGVRLSAPKTNLMRGERTTLTVEVRGLEGIQQDVPLQLDSKGVITMEGGNFQNLQIKPPEVTQDGRYTTTRAITGQQAGGFTVTATVIAGPFDVCIQDDSNSRTVLLFNTFTGDYLFTCPGPGCKPNSSGGAVQPGEKTGKIIATPTDAANSPGIKLIGTGKPVMKGCIITLTHDAPDRRVSANVDVCNKTGNASVQTTTPNITFDIMDKNITDNRYPTY